MPSRIRLAAVMLCAPAIALAQTAVLLPSALAPPPVTELPPVDLIGSTPLLGSGVDQAEVPSQTNVLTDKDVTRDGNANALRALNENVPGVTLDSAACKSIPSQPVLSWIQASPLTGRRG